VEEGEGKVVKRGREGSPKRGKVNVNGRERIIDEIRNDLFS